MVICLEQSADFSADLHMAQLMPLPLIVSCFGKIEIGLPFWYRLIQVVLDKGLLNGCVCMCVYSSSLFTVLMQHSEISLSLTKLHQNCVDICSSFSSAYWLTKFTGSRTAGTRHTLAALVLPPGNRQMDGRMDRCQTDALPLSTMEAVSIKIKRGCIYRTS